MGNNKTKREAEKKYFRWCSRRVQEKASNVGFDWHDIAPVISKVDEEIVELKETIKLKNIDRIKDEMGDVLFTLVNLSRFLDINPEEALRSSILKFENRFALVEEELNKKGKLVSDSNLEELDKIWDKIKKKAHE